ncbi:TIGR02452 family protein [Saccharibacillus alkalitolerans]|uniref:TIGR02452 family protein n=1 Tax=Saccharibacillus alkalitolerans TaxID=2705290 RepID=A0ABX0F620_9BACL|nr:TIGR02452 family protein [Saccharibacillus alkalitolerans]NGZ76402.1 TIGR02452 family protein [Saccharibacillus alkalitolerans]
MNERENGRVGDGREAARDRMRRIAAETVEIARGGAYVCRGEKIVIEEAQRRSEEDSILITPERGAKIVREFGRAEPDVSSALREEAEPESDNGAAASGEAALTAKRAEPREGAGEAADGEAKRAASAGPLSAGRPRTDYRVVNESAVKTVRDLASSGTGRIGLLNFASAKNPGGGFLNGANAQEENLAIASGLYPTQLKHPGYYDANRASGTMMYTHHAIYSPDVVFFRDERFELTAPPVRASVLTLPAVNYGQVLLKGEDAELAKAVMLERMRLALAVFAERGDRELVLGAYGCGVFRNDPADVAGWWRRLLDGEGWAAHFDRVVFAVLDRSKDGRTIRPFERIWGRAL